MNSTLPDSSDDGSKALLAVITVSYGSEDVLDRFFETLATATTKKSVVALADNKVAINSEIERIASKHGATYLPMLANRGYGGAINVVARSLPPEIEWILISNPDVTFEQSSIDTLFARGAADPTIGALGPQIFTATGEIYPSARAIPSLRIGIGHALFADVWKSNPWSSAYRNNSDLTRKDVGWLSGACLLVRRSVFDEIGGFDESFFMYFEDVDLGYRLGKAGYTNVYEPAAAVTHTGAHATATNARSMLIAHHQSAKRFLGKKYSAWFLWPVRVVLGIGLDVRSLLQKLKER